MTTSRADRQPASSMAFALASATLLIAQYVAGKATRDALFLSHFPVTELPKAIIAASLLAVVGVLAMSRLLLRFGPARVMPAGLALSAVLFAAEWLFLPVAPLAAVAALYLHVSGTGAILISGFWSVISERFDPHDAKRAIANVAAATTLGGVLGAFVAQRVAALGEPAVMLLVLALMNGLAAFMVARTGSLALGIRQRAPASQAPRLDLRLLLRLDYLHLMALLGILTAVASTLLDYALKSEAAARYATDQELMEFFSVFYAVIGVATFVLQTALGRRVLERFGLGITIALQPLVLVATGLLAVAATKLWTVVLARASEAVLANSFYRSSFELLYTPLPSEQKRATKPLVDVGAQRLGDVVGSSLIMLLLALLPTLSTTTVVGASVAVSIGVLGLAWRLRRGYVEQLARSLRSGVVTLDTSAVVDATTRMTLTSSGVSIDREGLLTGIDALAAAEEDEGVDNAARGRNRLVAATLTICRGDSRAIRRLLARDPVDLRLVPQILGLVANEELRSDALRALRRLAPRITGQVADAFLDPETPLSVRRWLPAVLEASASQRGVDGLMAGLEDARFELRYRCGRALSRMIEQDPRLDLNRAALRMAAGRELELEPSAWTRQSEAMEVAFNGEDKSGGGRPQTVDRSLEHVFTLLGLVYDRQVVALSLAAVTGEDVTLRGTALEYLENVLPDGISERLWDRIAESSNEAADSPGEPMQGSPDREPTASRAAEAKVARETPSP